MCIRVLYNVVEPIVSIRTRTRTVELLHIRYIRSTQSLLYGRATGTSTSTRTRASTPYTRTALAYCT